MKTRRSLRSPQTVPLNNLTPALDLPYSSLGLHTHISRYPDSLFHSLHPSPAAASAAVDTLHVVRFGMLKSVLLMVHLLVVSAANWMMTKVRRWEALRQAMDWTGRTVAGPQSSSGGAHDQCASSLIFLSCHHRLHSTVSHPIMVKNWTF
jgi:hypothetical protein